MVQIAWCRHIPKRHRRREAPEEFFGGLNEICVSELVYVRYADKASFRCVYVKVCFSQGIAIRAIVY
jgi:hypothetical protein